MAKTAENTSDGPSNKDHRGGLPIEPVPDPSSDRARAMPQAVSAMFFLPTLEQKLCYSREGQVHQPIRVDTPKLDFGLNALGGHFRQLQRVVIQIIMLEKVRAGRGSVTFGLLEKGGGESLDTVGLGRVATVWLARLLEQSRELGVERETRKIVEGVQQFQAQARKGTLSSYREDFLIVASELGGVEHVKQLIFLERNTFREFLAQVPVSSPARAAMTRLFDRHNP